MSVVNDLLLKKIMIVYYIISLLPNKGFHVRVIDSDINLIIKLKKVISLRSYMPNYYLT